MMNGNMNLQLPFQPLFQMDRMSNADPVHVPHLPPSQLCGQFEWHYQVPSL
jgi:hypothetical protein